MITYKLIVDKITKQECGIVSSTGWSIPFDPDNTDYQAYLAWVAQGNKPLPADK